MSKRKKTTDGTVSDAGATIASTQHRPVPSRIPTDAEVREAMRRARRMQARTIAGLFANLGK